MRQTANARLAITSWDERPYSEGPGLPKLTRAPVSKTLAGDIEGESRSEYLMMYREDGSATGDLSGLRGEGSSDVGHGLEHPFSLNYELV